mmetsp:Transcript_46803/g.134817  ORF Transcript_46803/g.134817 Transcript_46803/m.134817 type:complete len:264 (+) Transcript_46803:614-1405(+)
MSVAPEARDLAGALHLHTRLGVRAAEAHEGKHGHLACDEGEVQEMHARRLHVLAQHHARRELDEVDVQRLGDEGNRPRGSNIALDDLDHAGGARGALLRQELDVERPRDVKGLAQLRRDVHHAPMSLHVESLRRQQQRGIAAVATGVLDVLGDGIVDKLPLVGHRVELDLACARDVLRDHDGVLLLDHRRGAEETLQLRLVVNHTHRSPRQDVRRANQDRKAHLLREGQRLLVLHELAPLRLVDAQFVAHRRELRAILRSINR